MVNFWKNKFIVAGLIAVFFFFLNLIFISFGFLEPWQLQIADRFYKNSIQPSSDITIVAIDESTVNFQNGLGPVETWSRSNYAKVLNNINKYQPKLVAFDVFFQTPRDNNGDKALEEAFRNTENIIIGSLSNPSSYDEKGYFVKEDKRNNYLPIYKEITNVNLGILNTQEDNDTIRRRVFPGIFDLQRNTFDESFAFTAARFALNDEPFRSPPNITPNFYQIELKNNQKFNIPLEQGQMLINFFSNPAGPYFQNVSFLDVFREQYKINPEKLFKDKIILIGTTSFINDTYFTPVHKTAKMAGIEIHANAIQTILEQRFLRNMTALEKILFLFFLCLGSAFVFMFTRIRWSMLYLLAVPGIYTLMAPIAFQNGLILDLIHPYLALACVFVSTYMYRYLTEFKEKNVLKNAFSKYVNPEIIRQIMEHPESLKLGGEKREITVLFTDIAGFTSISEKLKPESLVTLLNEYFQAMSEVILSEGGTLDKFEGDAIMAFFGAPIEQKDHALRACRVAVKMRYKLHELLEKWKNDGPLPGGEEKPMIDFRCGISTGEVIVGNMGSTERLEYTVMGDIVNLGSRLEGANKKYHSHIMVSQNTYEKVKDFFEARELDTIRVVGKTEPIRIYEILAFKGDLPEDAKQLLTLYSQGMELFHARKYVEALAKFDEILKVYKDDGPSKLYRQRCDVLQYYPPREDWDGVFVMGSK